MEPPMARRPVVGIVGGGQLARMMAVAAIELELHVRVLARSIDEPAAGCAREVVLGDPSDVDVLVGFAAGCTVTTFDHELVPGGTLRRAEAAGARLRPGADAMAVASDKGLTRELARRIGVPVAPYELADRLPDAVAAAHRLGGAVVAKDTRGGYDGRGVHPVRRPDDLAPLFAALERRPLVLEPHLPIRRELAATVVRRPSGELAHYPVVETVQQDGVCRLVLAPAAIDAERERDIQRWTAALAAALGHAGVLTVEWFDTDGGLLLNELAPRPHNSAHYTIDACSTSQFENHLRAVLDLPLGSTGMIVPSAASANLLSGITREVDVVDLAAEPSARLHRYGKAPRPGRKVGHVTLCGDDRDDMAQRALRLTAPLATAGAAR